MRRFVRIAACVGALALVTGVIELLKGHVPVLSLAVLYLLAIIPVAVAGLRSHSLDRPDSHVRRTAPLSCTHSRQ